jgi:protein involved in polysaccharide export with SLBB domain
LNRRTIISIGILLAGAMAYSQNSDTGPLSSVIPNVQLRAPILSTTGRDDLKAGNLSSVLSIGGGSQQELSAIANAAPDYPVTPGDVYSLAFLTADGLVTSSILVDAEYNTNLAILGTINAKGLLFAELRKLVVKKVLDAYALSAPQVSIQSCGTFPVFLEGEVEHSSTVYLWGLNRLSSIWSGVTKYASSRTIVVTNRDGGSRSYDLFRVWRYAEKSQDPYLKPFDRVRIGRYDRLVSIAGSIRRPGNYELLRGEGMNELIDQYGGGLLPSARSDYSTVRRSATSAAALGGIVVFDASIPSRSDLSLFDQDAVVIPDRNAYLPVVYFEGAIQSDQKDQVQAQPQFIIQQQPIIPSQVPSQVPANGQSDAQIPVNSNPMQIVQDTQASLATQTAMVRYPFMPGDTLGKAIRVVADKVQPNADLRRAFLARKGRATTLAVDLEALLNAYDPSRDIALEPEDRIVIPKGSLDVFVTGEVVKSTWVNTTSLTRLSTTVKNLLTKYSSTRDILVRSMGGEESSYDLFKAGRYGDLEQDPFLKPGDTVIIRQAARIVTINGEVKRPETYQLLRGEGARELIEIYGMGLTEIANPDRISIQHVPSGRTSSLGSLSTIPLNQLYSTELAPYDVVTVLSIKEYMPVVWFEGALGVGINGEDPQAAKRIPYTFVPGETLSHAVQSLRKQFSAVSDLANAYIVHGQERTGVDIGSFLYNRDYTYDPPMVTGDTVIVPFRQFFVSVAGAVKLPGRYPYVPDRSWLYYVSLAGGIDLEKNSGEVMSIYDVDGKVQSKDRLIRPEDNIVVASNSFLFNFAKISSIISTIISVTALVISLYKII